jgi:hypothetical protein
MIPLEQVTFRSADASVINDVGEDFGPDDVTFVALTGVIHVKFLRLLGSYLLGLGGGLGVPFAGSLLVLSSGFPVFFLRLSAGPGPLFSVCVRCWRLVAPLLSLPLG